MRPRRGKRRRRAMKTTAITINTTIQSTAVASISTQSAASMDPATSVAGSFAVAATAHTSVAVAAA
eukprot:6199356-Pleurochrysis_carterae.AAC.7